jgi:hypothetical protein
LFDKLVCCLVDKIDKLKAHIFPAIAAAAIQSYAVPASPPHFSLFLNMTTMKILNRLEKNIKYLSQNHYCTFFAVSFTDKRPQTHLNFILHFFTFCICFKIESRTEDL